MRINHGCIWADARKAGFKPSRANRTTNRIRRTIQHTEAQETQHFRSLVTPRHAD